MPTDVLLPQWGMNMQDGKLVRWLVKEGDAVKEGDPLVEIETAKINSELEAPASGVVARILVPEGNIADVGAVVAVIAAPGEEVAAPQPAKPAAPTATPSASPAPTAPAAPALAGGPSVQVTPVARRLAQQQGIDLALIGGSGPNGRIVEEDVRRALEAPARPTGQVILLTGMRGAIAQRMMQSVQTTAPVTLTTEVDMTEAVRLRQELLSRGRRRWLRPLDLDLILHATARALKEHPRLNATLTGQEVRLAEEVDLGVAMALPDGIIVPVIRRADTKPVLELAREVREKARKARDSALSYDEVTGATFTVTDLSSYSVDAFTPIIDPPQVAILGVGRVVEKPTVFEGEITVRSMMVLSLTFDHRALDGAPAGEFLRGLKRHLEEPSWMLD